MIPIHERNRQVLQMRKDGLTQLEAARRFHLSPSRIHLIEKQDAADTSMAERRAKLREEIRAADDRDRMWPVEDLIDAGGGDCSYEETTVPGILGGEDRGAIGSASRA